VRRSESSPRPTSLRTCRVGGLGASRGVRGGRTRCNREVSLFSPLREPFPNLRTAGAVLDVVEVAVPSSGSVSVSPSASTSSPRRPRRLLVRRRSLGDRRVRSSSLRGRRRAQAPRPRTRAVGTRRRRPRRRVDRRWSREPNRSSRRGRGTRAISTGTHVNRTTTLGYRISRPVVRTASVGGSTAQCNDFPILGASSKLSPIANTVTHWAVAGQLGCDHSFARPRRRGVDLRQRPGSACQRTVAARRAGSV